VALQETECSFTRLTMASVQPIETLIDTVRHWCQTQEDPTWETKAETAYQRAVALCESVQRTEASSNPAFSAVLTSMTAVSHELLDALGMP